MRRYTIKKYARKIAISIFLIFTLYSIFKQL